MIPTEDPRFTQYREFQRESRIGHYPSLIVLEDLRKKELKEVEEKVEMIFN